MGIGATALRAFVLDAKNLWCPTWIVRNYEVHNDVIQGLSRSEVALPPHPVVTSPAAKTQPPDGTSEVNKIPLPNYAPQKFIFSDCGEPDAEKSDARDDADVAMEKRQLIGTLRTGHRGNNTAL